MRGFLLLLLTVGLGLSGPAWAETDPGERPAGRPAVGLVLGGGGARGVAHVGVLQALHELRIPVDYVAGSSMGAVVGAMFAVGQDPATIGEEILALDWVDLFSDNPDRRSRTFRRKQDDKAFFLPLEFGLDGTRIVLSPGLISGQKLGFALPIPELYQADGTRFDRLAYPFHPVATDLRTGRPVVLRRGNLLRAVRASMSIPGILPPVAWEGARLVDGGLSNNLPVDVVRAMGADVVIAVDVSVMPADTPDELLRSFPQVAAQTAAILARQTMQANLDDADHHVFVDLGAMGLQDFHRVAETVPAGRRAVHAMAAELTPLALSPEAYAAHLARHRRPERRFPVIEAVRVVDDSGVDDRAIARNVRQPLGRPLDLALLERNLGWIFDYGVFELVEFRIEGPPDAATLDVLTQPKSYAPNILNLGLNYVGGNGTDNRLEARARFTRLELNAFGGEWRTDLRLGRTSELASEWYQPLSWSRRPFLALSGRLGQDLMAWYVDDSLAGDYRRKWIAGSLHAGYRLGPVGEVRFGLTYGWSRAEDQGGLGLDEYDGPRGAWEARLGADMFDAAVLPRRGYEALARAEFVRKALGSEADYERLEGRAGVVHSLGRHSFMFRLGGGTDLGSGMPDYEVFTLGGIARLGGYREDRFHGRVYGLGSVTWYSRLGGSASPLEPGWYVGVQIEGGNTWEKARAVRVDDLNYSATLAIMARTLIGPVSAGYSRARDGHDAFHLTLGRVITSPE